MAKKFFRELISRYLTIDFAIMIALSLVVMKAKTWVGVACLLLVVLYRFVLRSKIDENVDQQIIDFEEHFVAETNEASYAFSEDSP